MQEPTPSFDPRVRRIELPGQESPFRDEPLFQWQTYEVFQQRHRGEQHVHVGSLHAPNPDMALILAKEQFGRREQCANLWVVKSGDIHATRYEDDDMFLHAFDKSYREGHGYKVKDTIESFQQRLDELLGTSGASSPAAPAAPAAVEQQGAWQAYLLPDQGKGPRKILVRKR